MRREVKKFLFMGNEEDREFFFKKAQELGLIHFINKKDQGSKQEVPEEIQQVTKALKILRGQPPLEQEENFALINANEVIHRIFSLDQERERLQEQLRVIKIEIARIEMFGHFSFEDLAYIEKEGHRKIQFFAAKPIAFEDQPIPEELIYLTSAYGLDYYIAIHSNPVSDERLLEIKMDRPLRELQEQFKRMQQELAIVEDQLKECARYNDFLHEVLIDKLNFYHLNTAQTYVQQAMGGMLFAIEGWVPSSKMQELQVFLAQMTIYGEEIAIETEDVIPTYLENQGLNRIGEDIIQVYDTPSPNDQDPSPWVLYAFILFFSIIIGDAGYGLVYLAIALLLRYKFPNWTGVKRRMVDLFTVLSLGCILWGILATSFFGMAIDPQNPIRRFSFIQWLAEKKIAYHMNQQDIEYQNWVNKYPELGQVTDPQAFVSYVPVNATDQGAPVLNRVNDNILFELALFIGVFHLILSLLRYAKRNWPAAGWIAFLIGAYLFVPAYQNTPAIPNYVFGVDLVKGGELGLQLMLAGMAVAVIASIIQYGITGIFELMTVIQIFGDVLSYLRLYALGLAGAVVSSTINEAAVRVPLFFAILLLFVAHGVNMLLAVMSGVIHGLRLNFLEWFHYSFEGGGKPFQPLKLIKKE
jgi:V/A-type H+-transporting ATPase subunit I